MNLPPLHAAEVAHRPESRESGEVSDPSRAPLHQDEIVAFPNSIEASSGDRRGVIRSPIGRSEMAERILAYDWASSSLGPIRQWPAHLRSLISLMLASHFPMYVALGPDLLLLYNDSYVRILGLKHPSLGAPIADVWAEIWDELKTIIHGALAGSATSGRDLLRTVLRNGHEEQAYFTFSTSPVFDDADRIAGVFCVCQETTDDVTRTAASISDSRRLCESERFSRATIDALAEHIAVIDSVGRIVAVNNAWRDFAACNGAVGTKVLEGANYLDACDASARAGVEEAVVVASMIREVVSGKRDLANLEYPCHSQSQECWFSVRITRFSGEGPIFVVVSHQNITARKSSERKVAYLATHDALTGLANRTLLADRATHAIDEARRTGRGLALLFLDLDNFKHLNDAYGHAVGDAALDAIARELSSVVRADDTAARLGGDEFVVLLTDLRDAPLSASRFARAILERLSQPLILAGQEISASVSIGMSLYPEDGGSFDELLGNADAAMYSAKDGGRNALQFYSADMRAKTDERRALEVDLRHALRLDQFELHYQPQVCTATGGIVGVEALIRWRHSQLGMLLPGRFISVAEGAGLILPIGEWVLRTACATSKTWRANGRRAPTVSVNISAIQLRRPEFVGNVAQILEDTGLDPASLELEITESMLMSRTESMVGRLKDLRALGVKLSIDDFGTGYSNLAYLRSFPLDRLKIDQSFVRDLPYDRQAGSIVRAIVAMGHSLGLEIVAEGVETAEQAKFLNDIGCERLQGYFYSVPLDTVSLEARLDENTTDLAA